MIDLFMTKLMPSFYVLLRKFRHKDSVKNIIRIGNNCKFDGFVKSCNILYAFKFAMAILKCYQKKP